MKQTYWIRAGLHTVPALFLLIGTALFGQDNPSPEIMNTLKALDRFSSYTDWQSLDSADRLKFDYAIRVSRSEAARAKDSLLRSVFLYHSGRLEMVRGNNDTAFADLKNALHHDISNYPALERLCALSSMHFKEFNMLWTYVNSSIEQWHRKCALDSMNPFMWQHLGLTYSLQAQVLNIRSEEKASAAFLKCIALDSNNGGYYHQYALSLPEDKRLPWLRKAVSKEESSLYRRSLIQWYKDRKRYADMLRFLDISVITYETAYKEETDFLEYLWREKAFVYKVQKKQALYAAALRKAEYYAGLQGR